MLKTEAWWLRPGISTLRKGRKEKHTSSSSARVSEKRGIKNEMVGKRWVERVRDEKGSGEMKRERKGEGMREGGTKR